MNKNTKNFRNILKKAKTNITVTRYFTQTGSKNLVARNWTIPFGTQTRLSHAGKPKVARSGGKGTSNGFSMPD